MLDGMKETKLKIIPVDGGDVLHYLKVGEPGFSEFGEIYFSNIHQGVVKAWKKHSKMTLNLVVPVGKVQFYFIDTRYTSSTFGQHFSNVLSLQNYFRLTIPPNIWFGFKGLQSGINLVANFADMVHDPYEVIRKDLDYFENVKWENL